MNMRLSKLRERVEDRGAWHAVVLGFKESQTWLSGWMTVEESWQLLTSTCVLSCQGLCLPVGESQVRSLSFSIFHKCQMISFLWSYNWELTFLCHARKWFCPSLVPLTSLSFPVPQSRRQHDEYQGLHPGPRHRAGAAAGRPGPGVAGVCGVLRPEPLRGHQRLLRVPLPAGGEDLARRVSHVHGHQAAAQTPGFQEGSERAAGRVGPQQAAGAVRRLHQPGPHAEPGARALGRPHQGGHGLRLEWEPGERGPLLRGGVHHLGQAQDHPGLPGVRGPRADCQGGVHAGAAAGRGCGRPLPVPGPHHPVHHPQLQHGRRPGPVPVLQRGEAAHRQEDRETGVPSGGPWGPGWAGRPGASTNLATLCPVSPPSVLAFMLRLEREVVVVKSRHSWTVFGDIEATGKQSHAQCLLSFH